MLNISVNDDFNTPVVTLEGEELSGVTSFEVKYSTKGKAKGVRFKVTIPTPEIVDGTPKFVSKSYTISTPQTDEEESVTQERADTLDKIRDLSEFWAKNGSTNNSPAQEPAVAVA